jgi:crossover junction endodeoxyribonuclease RuvC
MRILGIDPGLETTGYGIVEDASASFGIVRGMVSPPNRKVFKLIEAGVIKTRANMPIQARLKKIFDSLTEIIIEHKPGVLVLEKIYSHCKHPATAILMAHARAAVCLVCGVHEIQLINYPSTKIKKAITGNGHASKQQVQRMVQNILKLKYLPEPVDVSDALAMAISYCYLNPLSQSISDRRNASAFAINK